MRKLVDFMPEAGIRKRWIIEQLNALKISTTLAQTIQDIENSAATPALRVQKDPKGAKVEQLIIAARQGTMAMKKVESLVDEIAALSPADDLMAALKVADVGTVAALKELTGNEVLHTTMAERCELLVRSLDEKMSKGRELLEGVHLPASSWKASLTGESTLQEVLDEAGKKLTSIDGQKVDQAASAAEEDRAEGTVPRQITNPMHMPMPAITCQVLHCGWSEIWNSAC